MHENTEKKLLRDCAATRIPSGETITLAKDTNVYITQALGGSYTVATDQGLARIADEDADALGIEPAAKAEGAAGGDSSIAVDEKAVWDQLRTCYDPEIPVNIVDLGLVYDCVITPREADGSRVDIKMTLTAPGCGMGPVIASEAKSKVMGVPGVGDAEVELVWDPPWNQAMISEAGKMKLGLV
ncbi:MAG: putative Fe-S cluster assembly protein SufT [Chthoniobacter sp.]|uniref:putative Fe-S cluster assembly protein SufT n=1 Tax=Chthoniobacter sp. TaxID=2510640 RepID=UPI0032A92E56